MYVCVCVVFIFYKPVFSFSLFALFSGLVSGGAGKKKKNDKRKPQKKMDQNKESPKSKIKDSENNLDKVARKDRKHFKLSIG